MTDLSLPDAASAVLGRSASAFHDALTAVTPQLLAAFQGQRVLLTGGAGFIAGQTLRVLLEFEPAAVVLVDHSENGLAELVRDLRASGAVNPSTEVHPRLVDVNSALLHRVLSEFEPFDACLQFAACKHVRTERDPASSLQMLRTNVVAPHVVSGLVLQRNPDAMNFAVSTDKAADPSSLMGASKRAMEVVLAKYFPRTTSARFANVAFSSGSLLDSWTRRLSRRQVLAAPRDTRRFFVSPREAGELCAIAAVAPPGATVVPAAGVVPQVDLEEAVSRYLGAVGLRPEFVNEWTAKSVATDGRTWPVILSPRDTVGEKDSEVFLGRGETASCWLPGLEVLTAPSSGSDPGPLMEWLGRVTADPAIPVTMGDVLEQVHRCVPNFRHESSDVGLDDRI